MNVIHSLQQWYQQNCDGDWEHQQGIEITTIDNPGWSVRINLRGTTLESRHFTSIEEDTDAQGCQESNRWVHCFVRDHVWTGAGDETKLERILQEFLNWSQQFA